MISHILKNKAGQSLIATIIGVIIIGFVGYVGVSLYGSMYKVEKNQNQNIDINNLDFNLYEEIHNTPYANVVSKTQNLNERYYAIENVSEYGYNNDDSSIVNKYKIVNISIMDRQDNNKKVNVFNVYRFYEKEVYTAYGSGKWDDVVINNKESRLINTYAKVVSANSDGSFNISNIAVGMFGDFSNNKNVLIHVSANKMYNNNPQYNGNYLEGEIKEYSGNTIKLADNKSILNIIPADQINNYYVQVLTIPEFKSLTFNGEYDLQRPFGSDNLNDSPAICSSSMSYPCPTSFNLEYGVGGILAFTTKKLDISNGKVYVSAGIPYAYKPDGISADNSQLRSKLYMGQTSKRSIEGFYNDTIKVYDLQGASCPSKYIWVGGRGGNEELNPAYDPNCDPNTLNLVYEGLISNCDYDYYSTATTDAQCGRGGQNCGYKRYNIVTVSRGEEFKCTVDANGNTNNKRCSSYGASYGGGIIFGRAREVISSQNGLLNTSGWTGSPDTSLYGEYSGLGLWITPEGLVRNRHDNSDDDTGWGDNAPGGYGGSSGTNMAGGQGDTSGGRNDGPIGGLGGNVTYAGKYANVGKCKGFAGGGGGGTIFLQVKTFNGNFIKWNYQSSGGGGWPGVYCGYGGWSNSGGSGGGGSGLVGFMTQELPTGAENLDYNYQYNYLNNYLSFMSSNPYATSRQWYFGTDYNDGFLDNVARYGNYYNFPNTNQKESSMVDEF